MSCLAKPESHVPSWPEGKQGQVTVHWLQKGWGLNTDNGKKGCRWTEAGHLHSNPVFPSLLHGDLPANSRQKKRGNTYFFCMGPLGRWLKRILVIVPLFKSNWFEESQLFREINMQPFYVFHSLLPARLY